MISGRDDWSQMQLQRAKKVQLLPDLEGNASSPEDVIISKMRYYQEGGSDKHLRDSAGVLVVQGDRIDRSYIEHWVQHFGLTAIWNAILKRIHETYGKK